MGCMGGFEMVGDRYGRYLQEWVEQLDMYKM